MTIKKKRQNVQNQAAGGAAGNILPREKIQARAHEIYLARGAQPGRELDDWLQAEQELIPAGARI